MQLPTLKSAKLIRRYKRFLTDIELPNGEVITIHCANTGAMTGCGEKGDTVWYSHSDSQTRKYPHSWELTQLANGQLVCINTHRSNQLVFEALQNKQIKELAMYDEIYPEVKYGEENSRIDLLLQAENQPDCYIEVKSVTLLEQDCGYFPDAVTLRGQKHLRELALQVQNGQRAVLFFAVLHTGITKVAPAQHIDPQYAELLAQACALGVEVICYGAQINAEGMELNIPLPFGLS